MEILKEIAETNNRYYISNYGNVYKKEETIERSNGRKQLINRKLIKPILTSAGYLKVRLRIEVGKNKNITIHRMVAKYFVNGEYPGLHVNHIDGNKLNNNSENLEWVTPKQNIHHAWRIGLSDNERSKKPVLAFSVIYPGVKICAFTLGLTRFAVSKNCNDKSNLNFAWA